MASKEVYICRVFSAIAGRYDFLNALLSFNRDKRWRKFAVSRAELGHGEIVLDIATGTGDLALELARRVGEGGEVIGIDFCAEMLIKAREKIQKTYCHNLRLVCAKAEALPFPDDTFDCVSIGFALRNVSVIEQALGEMARVLRVGGNLVCLEFSRPQHKVFRRIYRLYIFLVLPFLGRVISRNREAYAYLPRSIMEFPSSFEIKRIMRKVGLRDIMVYPLTFGVATTYIAIKRASCDCCQDKDGHGEKQTN